MYYLLNSAVITGPGKYSYQLLTADEASNWLKNHEFVSRVGYPATADHIKTLSGIRPPLSRESTVMQTGDEALIVRLKYRVVPSHKHSLVPGPGDWEYGLLIKLS